MNVESFAGRRKGKKKTQGNLRTRACKGVDKSVEKEEEEAKENES